MLGDDTKPAYWRAAGCGAAVAAVILAGTAVALLDTGVGNLPEFVAGALLGAALVTVLASIASLLLRGAAAAPPTGLGLVVGALTTVAVLHVAEPSALLRALAYPPGWEWPLHWPDPMSLLAVLSLVLAPALVAGLSAMLRRGGMAATGNRRSVLLLAATAVVVTGAVSVIASLAKDGKDPWPVAFRTLDGTPPPTMPGDPSRPGPYEVEELAYGAGPNPRRPEFGTDRDIESRTVDATLLLPEWKGVKKAMREAYWGFGLEAAPLNARVWAPRGDGPFPLFVVVHGNHGMEEYSDPGYAYLGELLASRGYITVSVDENFINATWSGDFRGREMPLRAWLLLEHLALWRDWNAAPGHRFAGRVDMSRIALAGHSRGGEAIAIAHAFNRLPHYPDDATVAFAYGFDIRALVSIAQIDMRYHREVELRNVNFLTLHGSYDGDVFTYDGQRQMNRIRLDPEPYAFNAGIYIHGANHGQFNSVWGREDAGAPDAWRLNLAPLISGDDQRLVAKVYISAFLDATLGGEVGYLPLFRDPRAGRDWLPDLVYVQQFLDSRFQPVADYDEDLDVRTGTLEGATISASGFSLWREEELRNRGERRVGSSAAVLGWSGDTDAVYTITLPPNHGIGAAAVLSLAVSGSTEQPEKDDDEQDGDEAVRSPEFTIEVEDTAGRRASVRSTEIAALAPPLRVRQLKNASATKDEYKSDWEPVLQHVEVPLAAFPEIEPTTLQHVRLRFDGNAPGVVLLDDIGFRRPPREASGGSR